jgi:hypothetical protein
MSNFTQDGGFNKAISVPDEPNIFSETFGKGLNVVKSSANFQPMKRTKVFNDEQLNEAFRRSKVGDKFYVIGEVEQKRCYAAAKFAGRKISMRLFREGWKATVFE